MASYQDLDPRVAVLEDKVNFFMKSFHMGVQGPLDLAPTQMSLLDLYLKVKTGALVPQEAPSEPQIALTDQKA